MIAVVDAGPIYAAVDVGDQWHAASVAALSQPGLHLVFPALVVAEVCYLLGRRNGAEAEARFVRSLASEDVEAPMPEDWNRMADLVTEYADFPLGAADASVVALAERLNTDILITLDRRHFGAIRPRHRAAFRLLPEYPARLQGR